MRNQFTAIFEFDNSGDKPRYVARCPEIIGVSAEGKTVDEARERLIEEIKAELKVRREKNMGDIQTDVSPDAASETVVVQSLRNEFTAVIDWDEDWYIALCPEMPAANGQGKTREEAKQSLAEAILMLLEDKRNDGLRGVTDDAIMEVIVVP